MMLVPVPGVGAGSLTMEANLAQYIDSLVLSGHMWRPTWDPEGILSTVPAVVTCLLGAFTGDWLASDRSSADKALGLFVASSVVMLLGWIWSIWFPINKNLWTSSYVLLTGGMAAHILAWLYVVVDLRGWKRWGWPFYVYGSNALLVFLLTGLMGRLLVLVHVGDGAAGQVVLKEWIYRHWFASWAGPLNGSLAFALAFVLLWLFLMAIPYRYKLFFKV
jgi:predicted acyltransferase